MAASPTPRPRRADRRVDPAGSSNPALAPLSALDLVGPLAVAYSGGADSTTLLHASAELWPGKVSAIHVHHGLQPAADAFAAHCEAECRRLGVPLRTLHVDARHAPGESPEEAARTARYRALASAAVDLRAGAVLLGQHADDQVETVLLALSRGAGLPGLAAMPARFERHGVAFLRPLLALPGSDLRRWLEAAGIFYVEDPTNADTRLTRNRMRRELLPALARAFPAYRDTITRSARHAAEAGELLDEVAAADLAAMGGEPLLAGLQALSRARQGNVLRHWLRRVHGARASSAQLAELLDQVAACRTRGHAIRIKVGTGFVERSSSALAYHRSV